MESVSGRLFSTPFWLTLVGLSASPAVATNTGFVFDLSSMELEYTYAPAGKVVGSLVISDNASFGTVLDLKHLDLGADVAIGGGGSAADIELDLAKIEDAASFDNTFIGSVIELAPNQYQIEGTLTTTDTITTSALPSVKADFISTLVALDSYGFAYSFYFDGDLLPASGEDAILLPRSSDSWTYKGVAANTPGLPDLDGLRGCVTLPADRSDYTFGHYNGGYGAFGVSIADLDQFFGEDRSSTSINTQAIVIPEPGGMLLLLGCGLLTGFKRKRRIADG